MAKERSDGRGVARGPVFYLASFPICEVVSRAVGSPVLTLVRAASRLPIATLDRCDRSRYCFEDGLPTQSAPSCSTDPIKNLQGPRSLPFAFETRAVRESRELNVSVRSDQFVSAPFRPRDLNLPETRSDYSAMPLEPVSDRQLQTR